MVDMDFMKVHALGLLLKTLEIEPTLSGLIRAFQGNPDDVFRAVQVLQQKAPAAVNAVLTMDHRLSRIEAALQIAPLTDEERKTILAPVAQTA